MEQPTEENPYKSPEFANTVDQQVPDDKWRYDKTVHTALVWAAVQIFFFALWDMGPSTWLWVITLVAWGAAIIIILLRYYFGRSHVISHWDVIIIKFGPWPVFIIIFVYFVLIAHHH
jgi:hypothetical protein